IGRFSIPSSNSARLIVEKYKVSITWASSQFRTRLSGCRRIGSETRFYRAGSSKIDRLRRGRVSGYVEIDSANRSPQRRQCGTELDALLWTHRFVEDHPGLGFCAAAMPGRTSL